MKLNLFRILALSFLASGVCTTARAQTGPPVCTNCTGTTQHPICQGGLASGFAQCTIAGHFCNAVLPCGGGGGCFVAGTMIDTPDGITAIEDLRIGDKVFGFSDDGKAVINEVTSTYRTLAVAYYVINGEISVTDTHPFFVEGGWVDVQNLRVGDALTGTDGAPVLVRSIEAVDHGVRVFNISVSGNHTFFAGGSLVHNKEPTPGG